MKKIFLLLILMIPIVYGLEECPRFAYPKDIPCSIISTYKPSGGCTAELTIYSSSGTLTQNTTWTTSNPYCNATFNISTIGTYIYNSTIEDGVITVEGDDEQMILTIALFLIGINILLFALPFWVRFSDSEAGNYMVKKLMWIAAVLILWFNTTLFRQLASDWGLGIDNFLILYWWIFTIAAFMVVFIMCYVMVVGTMKLMKEAKLKERMGDYGY